MYAQVNKPKTEAARPKDTENCESSSRVDKAVASHENVKGANPASNLCGEKVPMPVAGATTKGEIDVAEPRPHVASATENECPRPTELRSVSTETSAMGAASAAAMQTVSRAPAPPTDAVPTSTNGSASATKSQTHLPPTSSSEATAAASVHGVYGNLSRDQLLSKPIKAEDMALYVRNMRSSGGFNKQFKVQPRNFRFEVPWYNIYSPWKTGIG